MCVSARVHSYTSVYVYVHLPVRGRFDDCVDRQSGREQAGEEAMSFNIPLSSPQYIHVGTRHRHRKYGGWCYHLSLARSHMPLPFILSHTGTTWSTFQRVNFCSSSRSDHSKSKHAHIHTKRRKCGQISHIHNKVPSSCVLHQIYIQILWFSLYCWSIDAIRSNLTSK